MIISKEKKSLITYKLVYLVLQLNSNIQEGKNLDLLQGSEEQESEEANAHANVNAEADKMDEDNNIMII